ncbi:MAG: acyltransferase [Leptothrix sp. (in: Bacteria)]|nr:acyltransferase [Leptothrix sp. (in: b-proteobacteria)]
MNRHNNFDLLRLIAAAGVMALHVVDLSREPSLSFMLWADTKIALSIFFIISGYLVYMSCERTPSLGEYASKRLRRIVPAYAAVVVACAFLGCLISALPPAAYFGKAWVQYLAANLSFLNFLQPSLPGVFVNNPMPGAPVNGALWTIKVELMFYAVVPLIVWLSRRFGHHLVLGLGFIASCIWWGTFVHLAYSTGKSGFFEVAKQMPGQLMFFLPGAWCYCERDRLRRLGWRLGAIGIALLLLAYQWDQTHPTFGVFLYPLALSACVSWAAHNLPYLGSVTRHGDFSYGIYILHFPIIQTLVHFGVFKASPLGGVALLLLLVTGLAWACWHFIEAPMLWRKKPVLQAAPA